MSVNPQDVAQENPAQDPSVSNKDYNFAQVRKQLEQERQERTRLAQENAELKSKMTPKSSVDDEDNYDEPYIDKKYFKKNIAQSMQQIKEEARKEARQEMQGMLQEEKRNTWLKSNPDFQEVMQHAQKFADADPDLAETILEMPEGFERQKLVYKNIKALGLHKPPEPKSTIQDKINQNKRSPFYQPSSQGAAPYGVVNGGKDYSPSDQKNAYDQMKALQKNLRLG